MFGGGPKPSLGLSISTSAANAPSSLAVPSSQPAGGSLFGGLGSTAASQSQQQSGLFGSASSQPSQSGGLFGALPSQPAKVEGPFGATALQPAAGGLFGSTTSQPAMGGLFGATTSQPASGGLFGSALPQPSQTGGLAGSATSQPASSAGLFGTAKSQPATGGGLFGSTSQPARGGGLFGTTTTQSAPSGGLFGAASSQPSQRGGLFGTLTSQPGQSILGSSNPAPATSLFGGLGQTSKPAGTLNLGQQSTLGASTTSNTRIDLEHLRPTTKFDQLTEDLQKEIVNLDTLILSEMNKCHEVFNLIPTIAAAGSNIPNDVAYVTQKLEEAETGLENDAADIQNLKEQTVKKDANEARVCFREVDRLKMPSQYQASVAGPATSVSSGVYGGSGLSGWWNHPQTLHRSTRAGPGVGGSRILQLPGDEDEDARAGGPTNLVDFFSRRTEEMKQALVENKSLLTEIEEFVSVVENKIAVKQREAMGRDGRAIGVGGGGEEDQVGLLRYVFGEFERSLYEVADKVGGARDGVHELGLGAGATGLRKGDHSAW